MTPHYILKEYFGFDNFRQGQLEIISAILEKKSVLAVMPTGAGKSLCYQIPALIDPKFSIVISPLIALMQDQVDALNKNGNYAAYINSSLDYSQVQKVLNSLNESKTKLLYIAPEKLKNLEFVETLKNLCPSYLFVDEAHCISEWGHNFRPSYRNIKRFANAIGVNNISAFTATATPEVREDIINQLEFKDPSVFVFGFERDNLSINVEHTKSKNERVYKLLTKNESSTIIYTSTRKNCERLAEFLRDKKLNVEYYHAGLSTELRKVIQDDFLNDRVRIIVATNAFGMGIDKRNIGLVIHYNIPGSVENLYQEIGRAGRDGNEAEAYLFYSEKDKFIQEFLISLNHPTIELIKQTYDAILDYYKIAVNSKSENLLEIDGNLLKLLKSKSINTNQLDSIIATLEKGNYLALKSNTKHSSMFKFLVTQEKLKNYIKNLRTYELRGFLLNLVQYYGSIPFERSVKINYSDISPLFEIGRNQVEELFIKLNDIGILDFEKLNYNLQVKMLQERVKSESLRLDIQAINRKKQNSKEKLNSIIEYCFTDECRIKYILNYFGENKNNFKCGKCDNCTKGSESKSDINEYISEIILRTFKEYQGGLSSSRLLGILTGKSKSQVAKSISTYQSCMHYTSEQIEFNFNNLLSKKIIKQVGEKFFLDPIEELIESEVNNTNSKKNYEDNLELYNKLREERNLAAKKFSQRPEIICSDNILKQIVKIKPTSPSKLMSISAFNQRMFNKLGTEILDIIKEYSSTKFVEINSTELPKHISQTYNLIRKKYSLKEISNLLKLSESIIAVQIESIVSYFPKDDYSNLITKSEFNEISKLLENNNGNIKKVKEASPSTVTYAKIRVVKAIILPSQSYSAQL